MRLWRHAPIHIGLIMLIALAAFFLMRVRGAAGVTQAETSVSEGHRLAKAWCESCHAVESHVLEMPNEPPSFQAIANQSGITPLALKVFLRTSHKEMPNIVIAPDEADALVNYILSLKAN
jgi:cytochrome c